MKIAWTDIKNLIAAALLAATVGLSGCDSSQQWELWASGPDGGYTTTKLFDSKDSCEQERRHKELLAAIEKSDIRYYYCRPGN